MAGMRRMRIGGHSLAVVWLAVLGAGCAQWATRSSGDAPQAITEAARLNGAWVLREIDGRAVPGIRAELVFVAASGELRGSDGCNRLTGRFTLESGRLSAKAASTRMACLSEPAAAASRTLGGLLATGAEASEVPIAGGRGLLLRGSAGQALFERRAQP